MKTRRWLISLCLFALLLVMLPMAACASQPFQPPAVVVELDRTSVEVGNRITARARFAGDDDLAGIFKFELYVIDNGKEYRADYSSTNNTGTAKPAATAVFLPRFGQSGYVRVRAENYYDIPGVPGGFDTGYGEPVPFTITGAEPAPHLTLDLELSSPSVAVGEGLTITPHILGGTPPYTRVRTGITIHDLGHPDGKYYPDYTFNDDQAMVVAAIPTGYEGEVTMTFEDNKGRRVDASPTFKVTGDSAKEPMSIYADLGDYEGFFVGDTRTITTSTSGGAGDYVYDFEAIGYNGDRENPSDTIEVLSVLQTSDQTFELTAPDRETVMVTAKVRDSVGRESISQEYRVIYPRPLEVKLMVLDSQGKQLLVNDDATIGDELTATATVTDGTPPYQYTFTWGNGIYAEENIVEHIASQSGQDYTHAAIVSAGQTFTLTVEIEDSSGLKRSGQERIHVIPLEKVTTTPEPVTPETLMAYIEEMIHVLVETGKDDVSSILRIIDILVQ